LPRHFFRFRRSAGFFPATFFPSSPSSPRLTRACPPPERAPIATQGPAGLESARAALLASATRLKAEEARLHGSALAAAAGAAVAFGALPPKLNPFIQPLMGSVRRETDAPLQARSAKSLASLIKLCVGRTPSPVSKIVGNVVALACADPAETPRAEWDDDAMAVAAAAAAAHEGPTEAAIARRGAEACLLALCEVFGDALYEQVPRLWEAMSVPLAGVGADGAAAPPPPKQAVVDACQLLRRVGARVAAAAPGSGAPFAEAVMEKTLALLEPAFAKATAKDADPATQRAASAALAALAAADPDSVVPRLLTLVIPALENAGEADDAAGARRGAAAVAFELVRSLGPSLAPFCVLLLVPLMGRMSDPVDRTREMATKSFAALVPLLPLARGRAPPATLTETQRQRSESDGAFLEALLDNSKVEDFVLPFECNRTLRPYQQEGVNWLAFLRRFKLHGALCDDMGLGKTLQSTCILAATVVERKKSGLPFLPALVVCPPTLVGHWAHEINEYVSESVLKPLEYHGSPADRAALRPIIEKGEADVVIMSYDSLRADADALLTNRSWCYCILDEGHAIRNPKSRVTQAVKKVRAENRLLLSGTPIQNDVVELWSLFDFLMPGFLGTEKEFRRAYGIAAARSVAAKKGGGLTEQGALATGRLHKQVMPFVMRRTKDEVLKDLPPKIIQDVYVDLSPMQKRLYDAFEGSAAKTDVEAAVKGAGGGGAEGGGGAAHVFQALQYLRKLCSHPRLVTQPDGKSKSKSAGLGARGAESYSPKFRALKQILLDCGVGVDKVVTDPDPDGEFRTAAGGGAGHRVLIFSQLKSVLDLVEDELFGPAGELAQVSWLRLDGSVAPTARFDVVRKFNADPSIDVLLLTTHVGGLGLNLTSADTVVFLEHDWNPQKDLQAMDRAHRLGQKRTVNVFRLLTKGTLEEKVMSLQKFKLDVANAVVNSDNMSLAAMDTGQMLELFTAEKGARQGEAPKKDAPAGGAGAAAADAVAGGLNTALTGLDELWDESQYKEEFALDGFIKSLNK
jgi:TATA-binding protein-associated factor